MSKIETIFKKVFPIVRLALSKVIDNTDNILKTGWKPKFSDVNLITLCLSAAGGLAVKDPAVDVPVLTSPVRLLQAREKTGKQWPFQGFVLLEGLNITVLFFLDGAGYLKDESRVAMFGSWISNIEQGVSNIQVSSFDIRFFCRPIRQRSAVHRRSGTASSQ